MLTNLNVKTKFRIDSKITSSVMEIIQYVLKNPVKVPNYLNSEYNKKINNDSELIGYDKSIKQISPFNKNYHVCEYNYVDSKGIKNYFENYKSNRKLWEEASFSERRDVFMKAADLIVKKYFDKMLAYTIVGQNKTIYEAEIDAICELADFLRFNVKYAEMIHEKQPLQTKNHVNISEYNSLNGFVASITPFNFTAIAANLASAPLLFGNSVLWKPSDSAILSNHLFYEIMHEAGLPEGVLNFCPMEPDNFVNSIVEQKEFAGLLFTGSSKVFTDINKKIINNLDKYKNFPRISGETGGKNFHLINSFKKEENHDFKYLEYIVDRTIESSCNFSGQKCSAGSIVYVPKNILETFIDIFKSNLDRYLDKTENYGVINEDTFTRLKNKIKQLKEDDKIDFVIEGKITDEDSYFIHPHVLICEDHSHEVFNEEYFGPILAIYPYDDEDIDNLMDLCCDSNSYALTGSIFSKDESLIRQASKKFKHKTGNFYINDKSTGAVVGQQPFGGSGKSGTNDKAGDINLLYKLFNQRNIKISHD